MKNRKLMFILVSCGAVMLFTGCMPSHTTNSTPPKIGTYAWCIKVEEMTGVVDKNGNGPEMGSTEWLEAVSDKIEVYDPMGHGPDLGCHEWQRCVHLKVFKSEPHNQDRD